MRRGIALLSALCLLMLLGLAIVGAVAATVVAQRTRALNESSVSLAAAADFALGSALANPTAYDLVDAQLGVTQLISLPPPAGVVSLDMAVTRLPFDVYWLVADAQSGAGERRIGVVVRARLPAVIPPAAVVARGPISLTSDVTLAVDTASAPDCLAAAGAVTQQSSDSALFLQTNAQRAALDSSPQPMSVRHVRGDTTVSSGTYQGILYVDGAVTFTGAATITGVVVARGTIRGAGLTLTGALLSYAPGPQSAVDLAASTIRYSPCEIARAYRRASPVRIVRRRGWAELF